MLEGMPPNNATHVMRYRSDEATTRAIADFIVEMFDPAETAAAAFEEPGAAPSWATNLPWIVEVFFADEPDQDFVRELVTNAIGPEAAAELVFSRVAQQDWVASSLEGLKPVRAGRFLVHGSHSRGCAKANEIGLEIEAALAFGTGHHGTTRGCLLMLDKILGQRRPRQVLDVGTGTGVLAIAAARALRRPVAAGDIDPISVAATASNARLNGAAPWVRPVVARGVLHPALQAGAPYDLVFANILARPLRQMAPAICKLIDVGGELVLSGLLSPDVPGVLTAYAAQGFQLAERINLEGWATLLMRRGGAAARPF